MYPFPVVLVGVEPADAPAVRRELTHLSAEIESELATPGAALECLRSSHKQVRLIIVQAGRDCDPRSIGRMAEAMPTWPILALLPREHSLEDALALNRAGAGQIVPLPFDRDDFRRAVIRLGEQSPHGFVDRHVIAVAGAVGGSGTSTIAINLAHEIAERLRRHAILAEFTLQVGALASMLDIHPRVTLGHLLQEITRVDDLMVEKSLVPVGERLRVLAGAHEVGPPIAVEPAHLARLLACFKKLADVSVLDIPELFHGPASTIVDSADRIVLVALQNIPSIRSLQLFCRRLPDQRLANSVWVAVNRYDPQLKGFSAVEIREMLGVPNVMTVANDFRAVSMAINQGAPLRQAAPKTPILDDIEALAYTVLGLERPPTNGNSRIFRRMFGAAKR